MLEKEPAVTQLFTELHHDSIKLLINMKACLELDMGIHKVLGLDDEQVEALKNISSNQLVDLLKSGARLPLFQLRLDGESLLRAVDLAGKDRLQSVSLDTVL